MPIRAWAARPVAKAAYPLFFFAWPKKNNVYPPRREKRKGTLLCRLGV